MPRTSMSSDQHKIDPFTELVTTQKLQHDDVMKEIAGIKSDIKEVKDGISTQIAEHNVRLMALETFRQTKAADDKISQWNDTTDWVKVYRTRWKWIAGLIGLGSMVAGWLLDKIFPFFQPK